MRRWILRLAGAALLLPVLGYGLAWWTASPDIGARPEGARLARLQDSPQWRDGAFDNALAEESGSAVEMLRKQVTAEHQEPTEPLPVHAPTAAKLASLPASGLRVTWLGHSTLLVELDGGRILIDPVWGEHASPWSSTGPERFYAPPLALQDLPPLDAVVISHDHYDHLDYPTVIALREQVPLWAVPLGIGAHLERWGVPAERIVELDWWEQVAAGPVTLTATPARHFSGRWLDRLRSTLWAGWALRGPEHSVFYSGDTALHPELEDIGSRLGPFDLTMMDAGAYDATWTDVHLGPEQTVIAHQMVRGEVLLPVHWGLFDLGNHSWTEPIERVLEAADRQGVAVLSPRPGESVELADAGPVEQWWPEVPHLTAAEDPVWSTGVEALITRWWQR